MDPNFVNEGLEVYSQPPRPMVIRDMAEAMAHLQKHHRILAKEFSKAIRKEGMTGRMSMTVFDSLVKIHDRNCRYNVVIRPAFD